MADISLHFSAKSPVAETIAALAQTLATWRRRARERRELATLDARTIHDIGLVPSTVLFEANKPFWRD